MVRQPERPPKLINLMQIVAECLESRHYRFSRHAIERQWDRKITQMEIRQVLLHGRHESSKDKFDEDLAEWNYSIRGRTVESRNIRIVVAFDPDSMLIVTVIDLDWES